MATYYFLELFLNISREHDYLEPETLLKLLTKHSPDMIWIKDLNNCYLYANDFMYKNFLNATQEELIGKNDVFLLQER